VHGRRGTLLRLEKSETQLNGSLVSPHGITTFRAISAWDPAEVTLQPPAFVIIARQIVSTFLFDDDESKHRIKFDVRQFRYDLSFGMKSRMPCNDGMELL
jgi:hypothetical protein